VSAYVLIAGAWHGGWCWHKVVTRLRKAGQRALALDLPSLGRDRTPLALVSLQTWTESVCQILDAETEPVVLVGHSRAGAVISQAAEARPAKIRALVYLAGYLLADGESVSQKAKQDRESLVGPNMQLSPDRVSWTLRDAAVHDALYGGCADEDVVLAQSLLTPEAVAPLMTPIRVSEERFGRVPRVYIECLRDRAVSLSEQRKMVTAMPCREVISLDTDHSPFFSAPDELTQHLLALAASQRSEGSL
jgi:pimeloyl-ACP methyl ester carboxylesterase